MCIFTHALSTEQPLDYILTIKIVFGPLSQVIVPPAPVPRFSESTVCVFNSLNIEQNEHCCKQIEPYLKVQKCALVVS